jgi:hypothetical protein
MRAAPSFSASCTHCCAQRCMWVHMLAVRVHVATTVRDAETQCIDLGGAFKTEAVILLQ